MPTVESLYSQDGLRVTVNDMIKDPLLIPYRFLSMSNNQYIMETIFRQVPTVSAGVIRFERESPLFADDDPEIVAEGAEIPLTTAQVGDVDSAYSLKYGSGIKITREMRTRGRTDQVTRQLNQVRNTFVRNFENITFNRLDAAITDAGNNVALNGGAWNTDTAQHRNDIFDAMEMVSEARDSNENPLGFEADTLVMSQADKYHLLRSEQFADIYRYGNLADRNVRYVGKLENQLLNLDVLVTRFLPAGYVYVLQRKTVGGWGDEYPLEAEPLEREPKKQSWYSIITRATAVFVDQPKAAARIDIGTQGTGV